MKRMIIALVAMFMMTFTTASAMSYEQARQQALFLTDKMAYELNLTEDQYEAAYEVNLDYLMSVDTYDELYPARLAVQNISQCHLFLPSALLACGLLALRHLRPLSAPRLFLLRSPSLLRILPWRS